MNITSKLHTITKSVPVDSQQHFNIKYLYFTQLWCQFSPLLQGAVVCSTIKLQIQMISKIKWKSCALL
jgi:hypothetical protein